MSLNSYLSSCQKWTRKIVYGVMCFLGAMLALGTVFQGNKHQPQVGDKCGENHHWVIVGTLLNQDMSCEAD